MTKRHLEISPKIWSDKHINPEGKKIYSYIYSKGFDRIITDLNVGEIQHLTKISNVGLRKHLGILEQYKYLIYKEYSRGMYIIHLLD